MRRRLPVFGESARRSVLRPGQKTTQTTQAPRRPTLRTRSSRSIRRSRQASLKRLAVVAAAPSQVTDRSPSLRRRTTARLVTSKLAIMTRDALPVMHSQRTGWRIALRSLTARTTTMRRSQRPTTSTTCVSATQEVTAGSVRAGTGVRTRTTTTPRSRSLSTAKRSSTSSSARWTCSDTTRTASTVS